MEKNILRSVDHIMVRVNKAEPMMHLFSAILGLPVSWPLQRMDFATYGWVTLGNANLEFWEAANNDDLPSDHQLPLFHGFALEPENLYAGIEMLEKRGVACKAPRPFVTEDMDGRSVTNFTNSVILDVSNPLNCIFFCEWGVEGTIFPWKEKLTTPERKRKESKQLRECDGGFLGVTGLEEIAITTPDIEGMEKKWLMIAGKNAAPISLGCGVTLSLKPGKENRIESLVIGVRSLAKARDVLSNLELLEESGNEELVLSKEACLGLHFRFREQHAI